MNTSLNDELLSAVLGYKAFIVKQEDILWSTANIENDIVYEKQNGIQYCINIYELAHKCKEWAFKQGYSLNVFNSNSNYYEVTPNTLSEDGEEWIEHPYAIASNEYEAIFKSCQWILDRKIKG